MNGLADGLDRLLDQLVRLGLSVVQLLQPGLSRGTIVQRLEGVPFQLPEEVHVLYGWRNGLRPDRPADAELFPQGYFLSLDEALAEVDQLTAMAAQVARHAGLDPSSIWDARWFPLITDWAGGYHVVLGNGETASPVYSVSVEDPDFAHVAYDSLTSMVFTIAGAYETGAYFPGDDGAILADPEQVTLIAGELNPRRTAAAFDAGRSASVDELVRSLKHEDGGIRAKAAQALTLLGGGRAVAALVGNLEDDDPVVRSMSARILGELRAASAVAGLVRLLQDRDPGAQSAAAEALGDLRDPAAVDGLVLALNAAAPTVRTKAAWALGRLRDPRSLGPLARALEDQNGAVRSAAVGALDEIRRARPR